MEKEVNNRIFRKKEKKKKKPAKANITLSYLTTDSFLLLKHIFDNFHGHNEYKQQQSC